MAEEDQSTAVANSYVYPEGLFSGIENHNYIWMTSKDSHTNQPTNEMYLYLPVGMQMADGASYGEMSITNRVALAGAAALGPAASYVGNAIGLKTSADIGSLLTAGGTGAAISLAGQAARVAINPNTVLNFSNNTLREFSLSYTFVPSSESEATAVTQMIKSFRKAMYAEKFEGAGSAVGKVLNKYPDIWTVRVMDPRGGRSAQFPQYADCYLTSFNANYNPDTNLVHDDYAPNSYTVEMTFREHKVLDRREIEELDARGSVLAPPSLGDVVQDVIDGEFGAAIDKVSEITGFGE